MGCNQPTHFSEIIYDSIIPKFERVNLESFNIVTLKIYIGNG